MESEKNAYILGTERDELHRLGLQHQVWASEARKGWEIAEFSSGQHLLDLGSGPGFCTMELAYMVGKQGSVLAIDKSQHYIDFLKSEAEHHQLNIELQCTDFERMELKTSSLDGVYHRWALAWLPNPQAIVNRIAEAMVPGAAIVGHEYFDWSTFQTEPPLKAINHGIKSIYNRFKSSDFEIDIGRSLPKLYAEAGLEVISVRPMAKIGLPGDMVWQWPKSFLELFLPKQKEVLTQEEIENAMNELYQLESTVGASILCPTMTEVVAVKV